MKLKVETLRASNLAKVWELEKALELERVLVLDWE